MIDNPDDAVFHFDGNSYAHNALSEDGKHVLKKLTHVDARLQQLRNELAVAETARRAYAAALEKVVSKV